MGPSAKREKRVCRAGCPAVRPTLARCFICAIGRAEALHTSALGKAGGGVWRRRAVVIPADFPPVACRVLAALRHGKRSSFLPACQSLQPGSALTLVCSSVVGKTPAFVLRELRMEGKIPFSYSTLSRSPNVLDKTSSCASVAPLVRERPCSCSSLGGVEKGIKIYPNPPPLPPKHRPEITDFPITKNTVLGQRSEIPHHCGARLACPSRPKASRQPSHHCLLAEGNASPAGQPDRRMPCADVSWHPAPDGHIGLR